MLRTGSIFTIQTSKLGYSRVLDGWSRCWPTEFLKWNSFSKIWNFLVIKEAQTKFQSLFGISARFQNRTWILRREVYIAQEGNPITFLFLFAAMVVFCAGSLRELWAFLKSSDILGHWKIMEDLVFTCNISCSHSNILWYGWYGRHILSGARVPRFVFWTCSLPSMARHCHFNSTKASTPRQTSRCFVASSPILFEICLKMTWCSMMFHDVPCSSM